MEGERMFGELIVEGLSGEISLIGFPYQVGAQRDGLYIGQDAGPDCMRRFLNKVGVIVNGLFDVDLSTLSVSDYGNIFIDEVISGGGAKPHYEKLLAKLQTKVIAAQKKGNVPFVVGGTRDTSFATISASIETSSNAGLEIITMSQFVDMRTCYDGNKVSVRSCMRKTIEEHGDRLRKSLKPCKFLAFSLQEQAVSQMERAFIQTHSDIFETLWYADMRRTQVAPSFDVTTPATQAGQAFNNHLINIQEDKVHLSFSLEAINSAFCPGVTRINVTGGLTSEEAMEIMIIAGRCEKVIGVDVTDFNPCNEDLRTGLLLANLLYHFSLGYAQRKAMIQQTKMIHL